MFLGQSSPRQPKQKPASSHNHSQEFIKYDLVRQRLDAEFREKIAKKTAPNTLPKPVVTPRRSSLQFSRDHFGGFNSPSYSENIETARSSRKSVGDIFGGRMGGKKPCPGQNMVRELSGDHPPMSRSQTWVEVGGEILLVISLVSNLFQDSSRKGGCEEKRADVGLLNRELIQTIKAEVGMENWRSHCSVIALYLLLFRLK